MFFEKHDVKQKLNEVLQEFAFKSAANKKVLKLCTVINRKKEEGFKLGDSSTDLGVVEKFIEIFRLRNKTVIFHVGTSVQQNCNVCQPFVRKTVHIDQGRKHVEGQNQRLVVYG